MSAQTLDALIRFGQTYGFPALVAGGLLLGVYLLAKQAIAKGFSIHVDVGRKR